MGRALALPGHPRSHFSRRAPDGLGISTPATHYYYSTKPTVLVYDWRRQARGHAEEGTRERVGGQSLETR